MTVLDTHPENAFANDRAHVFHSWSAQGALNPLVVEGAEGSYFWTQDGTRYLDFSSQLVNVNIGHQHPKLVAAIKEQVDRLCTVAPFHANDARSEAARLICEVAAEKIDNSQLDMVFFTNGGAEATENAVRMARLHTNRLKVLSHYRSYHGGTNGAISMTGDPRRWGSEPGMPGVVKFWGPYAYRSAFHATDEAEECERALAHLDDVLMVEGGHTVAAIIVETVVGTNGILVPPDGYLAGDPRSLRSARHRDDLRRGDGRVRPLRRMVRLPEVGRATRSGVLRERRQLRLSTARRRRDPVATSPTRSATGPSPAGSRTRVIRWLVPRPWPASTSSRRRASSSMPACSAPTSSRPGLEKLQANHPSVGEVRGLGVFWALDLVTDRADSPAACSLQRLRRRCQADGRSRRGVQAARAVAVHALQPTACGAAVHGIGR